VAGEKDSLNGSTLASPPASCALAPTGGHYDAGLLAYRDLDDETQPDNDRGEMLADACIGKNRGLLRQSEFRRLAGYEDVNDTERLRHDPARWIISGKANSGCGASASQMGRFEYRSFRLCTDSVHVRPPPKASCST
jgi:hypothetical protein